MTISLLNRVVLGVIFLAPMFSEPVFAQAFPLNYRPNTPAATTSSTVPGPVAAPDAPNIALPDRRGTNVLPPVADDVMTMGTPLQGPINPSQPSSRDAVVQRPGGSTVPVPVGIPESRSLVGVRLAGIASVLDGNTLVVNGQTVVLNGADAPEIGQTCNDRSGLAWRCGEKSARHLSELLSGVSVVCIGVEDIPGGVAATCRAGNTDFAKTMVRDGMAVVPYWMKDHASEQAEARADMRGIWSGPFVMPWKFREGF